MIKGKYTIIIITTDFSKSHQDACNDDFFYKRIVYRRRTLKNIIFI